MADKPAALKLLVLAKDDKVAELRDGVLKQSWDVNISNPFGQRALHIAALWGSVNAIRTLLELGAEVNAQNSRGTTPLHFAANAKRNTLEACQALLDGGADPTIVDMSSRVAYEWAEAGPVRQLLGGPDPRLFQLCEEGRAAELAALLSGGGAKSLRVQDGRGRTPANLAVASGDLKTLQVLLAQDPGCIKIPDATGDSPLHVAVSASGDDGLDMLQLLLTLGLPVNQSNINTSEYAGGSWLVDGETLMPFDKTPLHLAVENGSVEAAEMLLKAGAKPTLLDFNGFSALHLAVEAQDEELVGLMLEHGADASQPNKDFVSPLHHAAARGPTSMLEQLLAKGADTSATNPDLWTPLHLAARAGKADRVAALLAGGADPNAANAQGNTPLHLAAVNGHSEVCTLLLRHGAKASVVNKGGETAQQLATARQPAVAMECFKS